MKYFFSKFIIFTSGNWVGLQWELLVRKISAGWVVPSKMTIGCITASSGKYYFAGGIRRRALFLKIFLPYFFFFSKPGVIQ